MLVFRGCKRCVEYLLATTRVTFNIGDIEDSWIICDVEKCAPPLPLPPSQKKTSDSTLWQGKSVSSVVKDEYDMFGLQYQTNPT